MASKKPHGRNLRKARSSDVGRFYFLTTNVARRRRIFEVKERATLVLATLNWRHKESRFFIDAAVVMPDHLSVSGKLGEGTLSKVMHTLKSYSANRLRESGVVPPVWQPGYHDHALRNDEDYRVRVRYLIANPVRAGLVERAEDYPHLILPRWWSG